MKEWIMELCPEIKEWQAEMIAEEASKRKWVGLTDEEINKWNIVGHESLIEFVRAIEAKLKEKNT
jgi:hypothetical protein